MIQTKEDAIDFLKNHLNASEVLFDGIDFSGVVFDFPVDFTGGIFRGSLNFSNAVFKEKAAFDNSLFTGYGKLIFDHSTFEADVSFRNFLTQQFMSFDHAVFKSDSSFEGCRFQGGARFNFASFQKVTFFGAFFRIAAIFWHTIFNEDAEFSQCVVDIPSDLPKTADRQTNFSWAIFKGNTAFTLCNFSTPVYFWRTIFQGNVSFDYTHFHEETIWGGKQTDIHFSRTSEINSSTIHCLKSNNIFTRDLEKGYGEIYMFTDVFSLQDLTLKLDAISAAGLLSVEERDIILSEWTKGLQKMFRDKSIVSFNGTVFHKLDSSDFSYVEVDDVFIISSIAGSDNERKLFLNKINENAKDFFISHASEDKEDLVRPLAKKLKEYGKLVWFDENQIDYGEDLYQRIEAGLNSSKYCIIVLSNHFFKKRWTTLELKLILSKKNKVLFVWHDVDEDDVRTFSPEIAGKLAFDTKKLGNNIAKLATEIILHVNQR